MSKSADIAAALTARLAAITTTNGFLTNVGTHVYRGRLSISPDQMPCVVIVEGEDRIEDRNTRMVKIAQRYTFEAHDVCDPDHPNDKAHEMLADLKKAIFQGDRYMGGLVTEISYQGRAIGLRPDGAAIVAASIDVDAHFPENLTAP